MSYEKICTSGAIPPSTSYLERLDFSILAPCAIIWRTRGTGMQLYLRLSLKSASNIFSFLWNCKWDALFSHFLGVDQYLFALLGCLRRSFADLQGSRMTEVGADVSMMWLPFRGLIFACHSKLSSFDRQALGTWLANAFFHRILVSLSTWTVGPRGYG